MTRLGDNVRRISLRRSLRFDTQHCTKNWPRERAGVNYELLPAFLLRGVRVLLGVAGLHVLPADRASMVVSAALLGHSASLSAPLRGQL
jgi:hypothetical protein